jgi:hypothetical protein
MVCLSRENFRSKTDELESCRCACHNKPSVDVSQQARGADNAGLFPIISRDRNIVTANNDKQQQAANSGDVASSNSFRLDLIIKSPDKSSEHDASSWQTDLSVPKASLDCYQIANEISNDSNQQQQPGPSSLPNDERVATSASDMETCAFCKKAKSRKLMCANRRMLNLDDSAIFSSSIGSSMSNSKANKNNNKKAVEDNEDSFYCYSTDNRNDNLRGMPPRENLNDDVDDDDDDEVVKQLYDTDMAESSDNNNTNEDTGDENRELKRRSARKKERRAAAAAMRKDSGNSNDICCYCCCFCCAKQLSDSRFCKCVKYCKDKLKRFVDSKFYQRTILFAILINTLSMGIEHHKQVAGNVPNIYTFSL